MVEQSVHVTHFTKYLYQAQNEATQEFVSSDHSERAYHKLRKLRQIRSVATYLSDFRNVSFTLTGIHEGELK